MAQDRSLPPLTALQAFQAAGLAGDFQAAARRLAVTPSAISHQVRALEAWFGKPLFVRSGRQVELTRDGRVLLRVLRQSFDRIRAAAERIRGADGSAATLRISALPLFTNVWLIPRLERFERRHPEIALQIDTSNRLVDFARERVDLSIRNLHRPIAGLTCRKLLDTRLVLLCTPELAERVHAPADLARQTLIHISARPGTWAQWLKAVGCPGLHGRRDLVFDSVPDALEAGARGRGVVLGLDPLVWDAPAARALVAPFRHRVIGDASYYLVYRKADLARPALRACVEWLLAEMAAYQRSRRRPR